MADVVKKKKSRGLKKTVRRTLGTMFLVLAVVVAAIPTDGLGREVQAGDTTNSQYKSQWTWEQQKNSGGNYTSEIPLITKEDFKDIYTDETGSFQFAWLGALRSSDYKGGGGTVSGAMILRYDGGKVENGTLRIPSTVSAFASYAANAGDASSDVAVSQNHEVLYYMSTPYSVKTTLEQQKDEAGSVTSTITLFESYSAPVFSLCGRNTMENWMWKEASDGKDSNGRNYGEYMAHDFYYRVKEAPASSSGYTYNIINEDGREFYTLTDEKKVYNNDGETKANSELAVFKVGDFYYVRVGDVERGHQWICDQKVTYIGNQPLEEMDSRDDASGIVQTYKIKETVPNKDPEKGVFAGRQNFETLLMSDEVLGIGNYAFYQTAVSAVTFGNGLVEIGHDAFANSRNLRDVTIPFYSNLTVISDCAFANTGLVGFMLPYSVQYIYDSAFEGCMSLGKVYFNAEGQEPQYVPKWGIEAQPIVTLKTMGCSVFKDCTSLKEITLPVSLNASEIHLDNFEGCVQLEHITVSSEQTSFAGHSDSAKYTVEDFKGQVSDRFYFEAAGSSNTHKFTKENAIAFKYTDDRQQYEKIVKTKGVGESDVMITYQVDDNNNLIYFEMDGNVEEVEIPSQIGPKNIVAIDEGSFSDNCFLKKIVIPASVNRIGQNAFKGCHNLRHVIFTDAGTIQSIETDAFLTQEMRLGHHSGCGGILSDPSLSFTGAIEADDGTGNVTKPFEYAMSESGKISAGSQSPTYITYYSGWPQNLEIRYLDPDPMTPGDGVATLVGYPAKTRLSQYTSSSYPYITSDMQEAATNAFKHYGEWLENKDTSVNANEWAIINAVLNPVIPHGVKAVEEGLFNGAEVTKQEDDGTYKIDRKKSADADLETITFADLAEYTPYMFDGCTALTTINIKGGDAKIDEYAFALKNNMEGGKNYSLSTVNMTDGGSSIGNYAFENNPVLTSVTISPKVASLGLRPFKDCPKLESVNFSGGPYFTCESGVIFGLDGGSKDSVAECLEYKSGTLSSSLFTGVKSLAREAFMDCTSLRKIDLSASSIKDIPVDAFNGTGEVSVMLPATCESIQEHAFHNSKLWSIEIPAGVVYINDKAFDTIANPADDMTYVDPLEFVTSVDARVPNIYANAEGHNNIVRVDAPSVKTYTVEFMAGGEDGGFWEDFIEKQVVTAGSSARIPELTPVRKGYSFVTWYLSPTGPDISDIDMTDIQGDMTFVPRWRALSTSESTTTVRFIDYDDTVLSTQSVRPGDDAIQPVSPVREGYTFTGWRPGLNNIPERPEGQTYDIYAQYEKNTDGSGTDPGGTTPGGTTPGGTTPGGTNPGGTTPGTLYVLTVQNGSGSGSYQAGAQPVIIANNPASGQEFSHWTIEPAGTTIASTVLSATVITMPAANVTVTAHFKAKTGTSTGTGNSSTNNSNRPSGGNTGSLSSGTTVVIDKNGLSNTGVVSATVKGSSDNFTIKITEDSAATEAVLRALMAEYGNDLSRIKYFPMDISLYDASGTRKITDTQGLLITITLPLPDSLIPYAGNNKVAGVVNDRLDRLGCKFTTIDGVSCVTFTAEHFSPYVIYVDTGNLIEGMVQDTTPKTGDGIHPKWFLSMGLASMSMVMFMQKDKKKKNEKAKVRA